MFIQALCVWAILDICLGFQIYFGFQIIDKAKTNLDLFISFALMAFWLYMLYNVNKKGLEIIKFNKTIKEGLNNERSH